MHVEQCMGTVFTIDIRDPGDWQDTVADVVAWLHSVDRMFSTYRPDSDICRLQRREIDVAGADPDVAVVLEHCAAAQADTDFYFRAVINGKIDPTGLVNGWAIERASQRITRAGAANHAVNGGGDVQLAGEAAPGRPWTVGVTDPANRQQVRALIRGRDFAIATSGSGERGGHIVDPFTGSARRSSASATVIGPSLTYADAYATAAFLKGPQALTWIRSRPHYAALIVDAGSDATPQFACGPGWRNDLEVVAVADQAGNGRDGDESADAA